LASSGRLSVFLCLMSVTLCFVALRVGARVQG